MRTLKEFFTDPFGLKKNQLALSKMLAEAIQLSENGITNKDEKLILEDLKESQKVIPYKKKRCSLIGFTSFFYL